MFSSLVLASFLLITNPSKADAPTTVKCGGSYAGEDLTFSTNALNGVQSARTKSEEFMVFIDATRPTMLHVLYGEAVKDSDWEKLRDLRDSASDQAVKDLLSRLGSMNVNEVWMGWTADGFVHFTSKQREREFSFSCKKL